MSYILRPYQEQAVHRQVQFMLKTKKNGVVYMPTGSGKSLVIASTAIELSEAGPVIIFQPTKEILEQNYAKLCDYGFRPEIFSASLGSRNIGDITLATIGSVYKHPEWFSDFQFGLVDECHLVGAADNFKTVAATDEDGQFVHRELGLVRRIWDQSELPVGRMRVVDDDGLVSVIAKPKKSMYRTFFELVPKMRLCGYTATPYRLHTTFSGSQLKMITRTKQRVWEEFISWVQNKELFDAGYLAKLEYYPVKGFKRSAVRLNSSGADFNEKDLQLHLWQRNWETKEKEPCNFAEKLFEIVTRLLAKHRKSILVFTASIKESEYLAALMKGECAVVTGETPKDEREQTLRDFRSGKLKVVSNVGVLIHGFDFPELETIVLGAPTMSLSRYYQMVGRGIRPHPQKESTWIVDMVENFELFGRVEDLHLYCQGVSRWDVFGRPGGKKQEQLTSTYLGGKAMKDCCRKCGTPQSLAYYLEKSKWLPVSLAPEGTRGDLIIEYDGRKKTCRRAGRGRSGTHSFHFIVCRQFQPAKGAR